ncbi:MAG: MMPL family transporter [Actinomycetota bacterium]|nr:MAG: MMPL family transporter [Actinomycetota bacterium]
MARLLHRLGALCARYRISTLLVWVAALGILAITVGRVGAETTNDLSLPGTDSQAAADLLAARFPPQQNGTSPVVFHTTTGTVDDGGRNQAAIEAAYQAISRLPHVYSATDPFAQPAAGLVSQDHHTTYIPVLLDEDAGELDEATAAAVLDAATAPAQGLGMQVAVGGPIGSTLSDTDTESSELIGILAAMVILAMTFGSVIEMGLPLLSAVLGLAAGIAIIGLVGHVVDIPSVGPTLATMIGLGVGIDYALFLVTRHRDQLTSGMPVRESIARAVATSGSAIVFAGTTVVIALLALSVAGIPLVSSLGYATAIAVVTAVIASITALPAILSLIGHGVHRGRLPRWLRREAAPGATTVWQRWAKAVTGHPWIAALIAVAVMVPLIVPTFSLTLGMEDIGVAPPASQERQAFDLMSAGFGPGYNGPLLIATELSPPAAPSQEYTDDDNQANALKADLDQKQQTLPAQAQQLQAEQADLLAQQQKLESRQAALQAQAAQLGRQEAALRAEQARLIAERDALQAEAESLRRQARRIAARERELLADLAATAVRIRILQTALDAATDPAVVAALTADVDREQEHEELVRDGLRANRADARRVAAAIPPLVRQARSLQAQAAALQRQAEQLQQQGAALQREAAALQRQADELKQQGAELQQQADALQAEQAQAQAEQQQAEALQQTLTTMLTAAGGDPRGTDPRIVLLQQQLATPSGVALVSPPRINDAGDSAILQVIPTTRPADEATAQLVIAERTQAIPAATAGGGLVAYVGGSTASNVDLAALIASKLGLVIATVLALSFVLLLVAFRSLLVPVQAAVTNLLSVGAAFGVLTACFEWGWGLSLVGLDSPYGTVPIASYVPLMMFAALFGLSMDYQVFLVSQVQSHHAAGETARQAVRSGLAGSARVIVAAALIMIAVFASFILNPDPTIKQFGVGLSVAVLLAAIMVLLLAPALLAIFGAATWWLPRLLDRILPHLNIEGEEAPATDCAHATAAAGIRAS